MLHVTDRDSPETLSSPSPVSPRASSNSRQASSPARGDGSARETPTVTAVETEHGTIHRWCFHPLGASEQYVIKNQRTLDHDQSSTMITLCSATNYTRA